MRSDTTSTSRAWWALGVALGGLGALVFGRLLQYYGDVDAQEYRWKGPVSAVVIATVCVAAVSALQFSTIPGWLRGMGYFAVVALGSVLSITASASYYEVRCDDPGYRGSCGIPELAMMGWGAVAAVCVIAMVVVAEIARFRGSRRLTTEQR